MPTFTVKFSSKQYSATLVSIRETITYYRNNYNIAVTEVDRRFWMDRVTDMEKLYLFVENNYVIAEGE